MTDSIEVVDVGDLPGVACPEGQVPEDDFADDGNVYERRINQLAELGVVRGTSSTTYTPAVPICRGGGLHRRQDRDHLAEALAPCSPRRS